MAVHSNWFERIKARDRHMFVCFDPFFGEKKGVEYEADFGRVGFFFQIVRVMRYKLLSVSQFIYLRGVVRWRVDYRKGCAPSRSDRPRSCSTRQVLTGPVDAAPFSSLDGKWKCCVPALHVQTQIPTQQTNDTTPNDKKSLTTTPRRTARVYCRARRCAHLNDRS